MLMRYLQKYTDEAAELKILHNGKVKVVKVNLQAPVRLIPFHIKGKPPTYFIVAGLVFTPATVPYLRSEYGKEYDFDAPVGGARARGLGWVHMDIESSISSLRV